MAQETLEQTQRRLGLATTVTGTATRRQSAPSPIPAPPRKRSGAAGVVGFLVVAGIVGGAAVFGYTAFQNTGGFGDGVDWSEYPGTYTTPAQSVLAADSLEVTAANGDALLERVQAELVDYGFEWTVLYPGGVTDTDNGYDGTSMLSTYDSDTLLGSASATNPVARQRIVAIFAEIMAEDPDNNVIISNDEYEGEDAEYYLGSTDRDRQALWSVWTYRYNFNGLEADLEVYDASVTTDGEFYGVYWLPDDAQGTLFVRLHVTARDQLSITDRDAFRDALEPYAGKDLPDPYDY